MISTTLIIRIAQASNLIPIITGFLNYKNNKKLNVIILLPTLSLINELFSKFFAVTFHNNSPIFRFDTDEQFFLLSLLFYWEFYNIKRKRILTLVLVGIFFISEILDLTYINGVWKFNSISGTIGGIFILILCLINFYSILKETNSIDVWHIPMFWVSVASLYYYLTNIFYFSIPNFILSNDELGTIAKTNHNLVYILYSLLLSKSILCMKTYTL